MDVGFDVLSFSMYCVFVLFSLYLCISSRYFYCPDSLSLFCSLLGGLKQTAMLEGNEDAIHRIRRQLSLYSTIEVQVDEGELKSSSPGQVPLETLIDGS